SAAPAAATTVAQLEGLGLNISDGCTSDVNLVVSHADVPSGRCPLVITRTYTVTDACNHSSPVVNTININDTTAPLISGTIAVSTRRASDLSAAPAAATTVAQLEGLGLNISDGCTSDANLVVSHLDAPSGTCPLVITRTYTVTDACNHSSPVVHTININDTTAPVISGTIAVSNIDRKSVV